MRDAAAQPYDMITPVTLHGRRSTVRALPWRRQLRHLGWPSFLDLRVAARQPARGETPFDSRAFTADQDAVGEN